MNNEQLLTKTKSFLADYLANRVRIADNRCFLDDIEIPPNYSSNPCVSWRDIHKERFSEIYDSLPKRSIDDFVSCVSRIPNLVVIQLTDFNLGTDFGLKVADRKKDAQVHIYMPLYMHRIPPFLYNGIRGNFRFRSKIPFLHRTQEDDINALFQDNRVGNATYHRKDLFKNDLEQLAEKYSSKNVMFVSIRTPTFPEERCSQIADVVSRFDNTGMLLAPFLNDEIKEFGKTLKDLSKRGHMMRYKNHCFGRVTPVARLFVALSGLYAVETAKRADAKVFRERFQIDVYQQPTHYVYVEPRSVSSSGFKTSSSNANLF